MTTTNQTSSPLEPDLAFEAAISLVLQSQGHTDLRDVPDNVLCALLEHVKENLAVIDGQWQLKLPDGRVSGVNGKDHAALSYLVHQIRERRNQSRQTENPVHSQHRVASDDPRAQAAFQEFLKNRDQPPMNTSPTKQRSFKDKARAAFENFRKSRSRDTLPNIDDMPTTDDGTHAQYNNAPLLLKILRFCLLIGIGIFALSNIKPYIDIVGFLGASLMRIPAVPYLVNVPVIGWLITTGAGIVQTLLGVALWAILQLFELLPTIMMNSPAFLVAAIAFYRGHRKLAAENSDNRLIRQLKAKYNSLPTQWIETANHNKAIAYIVDAALCLAFYPPIVGGWDNIGMFFMAPSPTDIDWSNLLLALSSLFLVEVLYHGFHFASNAVRFFDKDED